MNTGLESTKFDELGGSKARSSSNPGLENKRFAEPGGFTSTSSMSTGLAGTELAEHRDQERELDEHRVPE